MADNGVPAGNKPQIKTYVISGPFPFTMYSNTFCGLTVTSLSISDSTDSAGQMSCDKVVTNVFWHQWADVMFYYPVDAPLFQPHELQTNTHSSLIPPHTHFTIFVSLWHGFVTSWICGLCLSCPWAGHQQTWPHSALDRTRLSPEIIPWLLLASILRGDRHKMLVMSFCLLHRCTIYHNLHVFTAKSDRESSSWPIWLCGHTLLVMVQWVI